ncbi:MAG: hypothetical protein ACLPKB_35455 [Xanthobacteraceae bacterium]
MPATLRTIVQPPEPAASTEPQKVSLTASSPIGIGVAAGVQTSAAISVETAVTRATISILPTLYPEDPGGAVIVQNHVTINIDSAPFHELSAKLDEVCDLLRQSNAIAGETQEKLIAEIAAGITLLKSPKPDPKMIDLLLKRPLMFIVERGSGAIVGAAAAGALALLGRLTGMW